MNLRTFRNALLLLLAGLLLGGCESFESVRENFRDRVTGVPPKTHVVAGEAATVFQAARAVMERSGYAFSGGGAAQGRLEGLTRIDRGGEFGASRQRSISIHLVPAEPGKIEVQVLITEIVEEASGHGGGATDQRELRDSAEYGSFFADLEHELQLPAAK